MPDQWLTTKELSALMKIPVTTIYDWRTVRRPCPPAVRIGKHLRGRRVDVEDWLAGRVDQFK